MNVSGAMTLRFPISATLDSALVGNVDFFNVAYGACLEDLACRPRRFKS